MVVIPPNNNNFPPPVEADTEGIAIIGSNLHMETLLKAYKLGYFPWDKIEGVICWFHPDPRFILFPEKVRISKSMRPYLNQRKFVFTIDRDFKQVIHQCGVIPRSYGRGSWINDEIEEAYGKLHQNGYAQSAEVWNNGNLVGGLYGIRMGKVFFGESMFAHESNASKYALIKYVQYLQKEGVRLIDCQSETRHLVTMGAESIPRKRFLELLREWIP